MGGWEKEKPLLVRQTPLFAFICPYSQAPMALLYHVMPCGKEHLRQLLLDLGVEQDDLAFWTWPDGIDARKNLLSHTAPPRE
jgi:hypothetical protein